MKLTAKGRYAVAALADLASQPFDSGPVPVRDISVRQGISIGYLEQILLRLRNAGLVDSVRGASGGYALARPAADIRIAEIVRAVDENIRTTACEPGRSMGCQGTSARCLTHDLWDELGRQIDIFLNAVSLDDVISKQVLGRAGLNGAVMANATPDPNSKTSIEEAI